MYMSLNSLLCLAIEAETASTCRQAHCLGPKIVWTWPRSRRRPTFKGQKGRLAASGLPSSSATVLVGKSPSC